MKMKDTKQYTYSFDGEYWEHEVFDSLEECLEAVKNDEEYSKTESYYIGEAIDYEISIDANEILCMIEEQTSSDVGDAADNWIADVEDIHMGYVKILEDDITNVVNKWLKKHHCLPDFKNIKNIKEYTVNE